ncbi:VanZ family protein [Neobacillus sp. 179-C4.2 HS]|uniref:VanZ family protein n=1 Tax=Neobacillus driksii TaxID=3035913 RepID=A0ABV4Z1I8_9BACI|nr:VanZ family protein [Neobacillus sp. 179.-C4.2 HS]MDP5195970.1 VanZ family protein [Neobacillus sp. 179.-C4.2 HS]
MYSLGRFLILILPVFYMYLIWQQTSHFDPESVSWLSTVLSDAVILAIGATLELAHLFEFGILYFLVILALLSYGHLSKLKEILAIFISLLYGLTDEIHQLFVPFRSFSIIDLIKNAIGVFAIWIIINKKYYSKKHSRLGSFLSGITKFFKMDSNNVPF